MPPNIPDHPIYSQFTFIVVYNSRSRSRYTSSCGFLLHLQVNPGIEVVGGDVDVVEGRRRVGAAGAGHAGGVVLARQPNGGLAQGTCLARQ